MILNIETKLSEYDIVIEKNILSFVGDYISKLLKEKSMSVKKIFIVTDERVDSIYGLRLEESLIKNDFEIKKYVIKEGEASKNILALTEIYSEMADFSMTRTDMIIAFGGGVVGDLAGFAASSYLRGIKYIQLPTTLLAQVDSSIGGKTAIDISQGKNLVGSFYNPYLVVIDPTLLETLDIRQLRNGMAEVIKYALIKDRNMYDMLMKIENKRHLFEKLDEIIYRSCSIKKEIVENDQFDRGERMILNFGHTIGHAIESHYKFKKYLHGEAVAIGMLRISELAFKKGLLEEKTVKDVKNILNKFSLPSQDDISNKELIKYIKNDKKNFGNKIKVVILKEVGRVELLDRDIEFFN